MDSPVSPSNSSADLSAALRDFARDAKRGTFDTGPAIV
jgi:hypothetical protein